MDLAGYQDLALIHEGQGSRIFRGTRVQDGVGVILKIMGTESPTPGDLTRFRKEYEILGALADCPHVIRALSLDPLQNGMGLILEDFGGVSLSALSSERRLALGDALGIALEIARALDEIHGRHVIHKDINPTNILFNPQTRQLKIIDFGLATMLSSETMGCQHPNRLQGTLEYISPEQTGRMNRAVDYRTDFYSFGATLYELLTGRPPFPGNDSMEVMHAHLAKRPTPPGNLCPAGQDGLSDLVMKLLAKSPEDRYQSARGLIADLQECSVRLLKRARIDAFVLGEKDLVERLIVPEKLYGREAEIEALRAGFEQAQKGGRELVLLSGPSGVGKTALVQELYKPLARTRGYFITGKFDPLQRNMPYSALIVAFRKLARMLLAEPEAALGHFRDELCAALGDNGQVILDLLPEFEAILGAQEPLLALPPEERQNRFNRVFEKFVSVFARAEHPLLLFVDDLQWADDASLKLIELLMSSPAIQSLFLIGAFRDNEVSAGHPLLQAILALEQEGCVLQRLQVAPLGVDAVNQILAETLHYPAEKTRALSELLQERTEGNPFFLKEYLAMLADVSLLCLDRERGRWQWNIESIRKHGITDSAADLMIKRLSKLDQDTLELLQLASCLGTQFDKETLSTVGHWVPERLSSMLEKAVDAGMLIMEEDETRAECRFVHNKVQQAAYSMVPERDRPGLHHVIGKKLSRSRGAARMKEKAFEIVHHWNLCPELVTEPAEQQELVTLNLYAGQRAKESTAFQQALEYLRKGVAHHQEAFWADAYEVSIALYLEAAEAAYLCGQDQETERYLKVALDRCRSLLDRVRALQVRIRLDIRRDNNEMAMQTAREALALLDLHLPRKVTALHILAGLARLKLKLLRVGFDGIAELPEMASPHKLAAMRLMTEIGPAAYLFDRNQFVMVVIRTVLEALQHGNSAYACGGYCGYGVLLCGVLGNVPLGYRFGKLSLALAGKFEDRRLQGSLFFIFGNFIAHWREPLVATLKYLEEAHRLALENGDMIFASHAASNHAYHSYFAGCPLDQVRGNIERFHKLLQRIDRKLSLHTLDIYHQSVLNLIGASKDPTRLTGEAYNEDQLLPEHLQSNARVNVFDVHLCRLVLGVIFHDDARARESEASIWGYLDEVVSAYCYGVFHFYGALSLLAEFHTKSQPEQRQARKRARANLKKLKRWAQNAPENYLHKVYLVEAEMARVRSHFDQAAYLYDLAIQKARENKFVNEEGLSCELAGRFCLDQGKTIPAKSYLENARNAYLQWGALAKVKDIDQRYAHLIGKATLRHFQRRTTPISESVSQIRGPGVTTGQLSVLDKITSALPSKDTQNGTLEALFDLGSILKASQSLSCEIEQDKLLAILMKVVIENAGADRGFLILSSNGELFVSAQVDLACGADAQILSQPLSSCPDLSQAIVRYVARTRTHLLRSSAEADDGIGEDPYFSVRSPASILCLPVLHQADLVGVLYLENNQIQDAFTPARVEVLTVLIRQAAISIENARLIGQLKESASKLSSALAEAEESARVKQELLARTSHELRTPLNAIINLPEMVLQMVTAHPITRCAACDALFEQTRGPEEADARLPRVCPQCGQTDCLQEDVYQHPQGELEEMSEIVAAIHSSGQSLMLLVNNLLYLSTWENKRSLLNVGDICVGELVAHVVELAAPQAARGDIALRPVEISPALFIRADWMKLGQVLYNLLDNAIKFSPRGSQVTIGVIAAGDSVSFVVQDQGIGIDEKNHQLIFESFRQVEEGANRKFGGTGLGLAVAKSLVELHAGEIWVESALGQGSVFHVHLPRQVDAQGASGEGWDS